MGEYVPEDAEWDKAIRLLMQTVRKCPLCGIVYRPIDNIGSWKCKQRIPDRSNGRDVWVRADHPKELYAPYTPQDDVVVSACAWPYFQTRVLPDAVSTKPVTGKDPSGRRHVFAAVKVQRYDQYAEVQIRYGARQLDT